MVRPWVVFVQLLFSSEPRNSPTFATDSKYVLSTNVPIKLTSMNFEALTVRQPPVPLAGDAGQVMMPAPDGRQLPADWHQYQSERHPTPHHTTPHHTTPTGRGTHRAAVLWDRFQMREVRRNLFAACWVGIISGGGERVSPREMSSAGSGGRLR